MPRNGAGDGQRGPTPAGIIRLRRPAGRRCCRRLWPGASWRPSHRGRGWRGFWARPAAPELPVLRAPGREQRHPLRSRSQCKRPGARARCYLGPCGVVNKRAGTRMNPLWFFGAAALVCGGLNIHKFALIALHATKRRYARTKITRNAKKGERKKESAFSWNYSTMQRAQGAS